VDTIDESSENIRNNNQSENEENDQLYKQNNQSDDEVFTEISVQVDKTNDNIETQSINVVDFRKDELLLKIQERKSEVQSNYREEDVENYTNGYLEKKNDQIYDDKKDWSDNKNYMSFAICNTEESSEYYYSSNDVIDSKIDSQNVVGNSHNNQVIKIENNSNELKNGYVKQPNKYTTNERSNLYVEKRVESSNAKSDDLYTASEKVARSLSNLIKSSLSTDDVDNIRIDESYSLEDETVQQCFAQQSYV